MSHWNVVGADTAVVAVTSIEMLNMGLIAVMVSLMGIAYHTLPLPNSYTKREPFRVDHFITKYIT